MTATCRAFLRLITQFAYLLGALLLIAFAAPMCAATTGTGPIITNATITPGTLPLAGGVITVTATITDAAGRVISPVTATVTLTGSATYSQSGGYGQSATLTLSNGGSGSVYTGNISSNVNNTTTAPFTYTATITATNDLSLSTSATATGQTVQANDATPPMIANASITPTALPSTGGIITVTATITDPAGRAITAANATVTLTGSATYSQSYGGGQSATLTLSNGGNGNVYTGNISSNIGNTGNAPYTYTATITATNDLRFTNTATAAGKTVQADSMQIVPQTSHTHLLWQNTNGTVSLWTIGSDHSYTYKNYGPYAGWTAKSVSDGPDGVAHILWVHTADGLASIWDITGNGFNTTSYGPFAGWSPLDISSGL